jgi:hypothetical protein
VGARCGWWKLESGAGGKHDFRLVFPPRPVSVSNASVPMHVSGDVNYCGRDLGTDCIPGSDVQLRARSATPARARFRSTATVACAYSIAWNAVRPVQSVLRRFATSSICRALLPSSQPAERVRAIPEVQESEAKVSIKKRKSVRRAHS